MTPALQSVIDDSKALLAAAEPAFKKIAVLEEQAVTLTSKMASLEMQKQALDEVIKTAAVKAAAFFGDRGMLKCSADEFAQTLQDNPAEIFAAVESFIDHSTLKEAGLPTDDGVPANGLDAIATFCATA